MVNLVIFKSHVRHYTIILSIEPHAVVSCIKRMRGPYVLIDSSFPHSVVNTIHILMSSSSISIFKINSVFLILGGDLRYKIFEEHRAQNLDFSRRDFKFQPGIVRNLENIHPRSTDEITYK